MALAAAVGGLLSCRDPLATKGDEAVLIGAVESSPRSGVAVCCRPASVNRSGRRARGEGLAGRGADVCCATLLHVWAGRPGFEVGMKQLLCGFGVARPIWRLLVFSLVRASVRVGT